MHPYTSQHSPSYTTPITGGFDRTVDRRGVCRSYRVCAEAGFGCAQRGWCGWCVWLRTLAPVCETDGTAEERQSKRGEGWIKLVDIGFVGHCVGWVGEPLPRTPHGSGVHPLSCIHMYESARGSSLNHAIRLITLGFQQPLI